MLLSILKIGMRSVHIACQMKLKILSGVVLICVALLLLSNVEDCVQSLSCVKLLFSKMFSF